jgi:hypothetical protein
MKDLADGICHKCGIKVYEHYPFLFALLNTFTILDFKKEVIRALSGGHYSAMNLNRTVFDYKTFPFGRADLILRVVKGHIPTHADMVEKLIILS